jgi:plastocyanin
MAIAAPSPGAFPSGSDRGEEMVVAIRQRQFEPSRLVLHVGRPTTLTLFNNDAELHAFVPVGLFTGVEVRVSGNGAAEFDENGFKRVIIPSGGRAEFQFIPDRPGEYPFFCDMPGHEMKATIKVE